MVAEHSILQGPCPFCPVSVPQRPACSFRRLPSRHRSDRQSPLPRTARGTSWPGHILAGADVLGARSSERGGAGKWSPRRGSGPGPENMVQAGQRQWAALVPRWGPRPPTQAVKTGAWLGVWTGSLPSTRKPKGEGKMEPTSGQDPQAKPWVSMPCCPRPASLGLWTVWWGLGDQPQVGPQPGPQPAPATDRLGPGAARETGGGLRNPHPEA